MTLDPVKLKQLLRDDNAVEMSRLGLFSPGESAEARAWTTAGWDIGRRSLDDSLDKNLQATGSHSFPEPQTSYRANKTLAIVTG